MSLKGEIFGALDDPVRHAHKSNSIICYLDDDRIAKFPAVLADADCHNHMHTEMDNMLTIAALNDPDIRLPAFYDIVDLGLGRYEPLKDITHPNMHDQEVYAIVMERLHGRFVDRYEDIPTQYHPTIQRIIAAFLRNNINCADAISADEFCLEPDKEGVILVDWEERSIVDNLTAAQRAYYDEVLSWLPSK